MCINHVTDDRALFALLMGGEKKSWLEASETSSIGERSSVKKHFQSLHSKLKVLSNCGCGASAERTVTFLSSVTGMLSVILFLQLVLMQSAQAAHLRHSSQVDSASFLCLQTNEYHQLGAFWTFQLQGCIIPGTQAMFLVLFE